MNVTLHLLTFSKEIRPKGRFINLLKDEDHPIVNPNEQECACCKKTKPIKDFRVRWDTGTMNRQCNQCLAIKKQSKRSSETPEQREARLVRERAVRKEWYKKTKVKK